MMRIFFSWKTIFFIGGGICKLGALENVPRLKMKITVVTKNSLRSEQSWRVLF